MNQNFFNKKALSFWFELYLFICVNIFKFICKTRIYQQKNDNIYYIINKTKENKDYIEHVLYLINKYDYLLPYVVTLKVTSLSPWC